MNSELKFPYENYLTLTDKEVKMLYNELIKHFAFRLFKVRELKSFIITISLYKELNKSCNLDAMVKSLVIGNFIITTGDNHYKCNEDKLIEDIMRE